MALIFQMGDFPSLAVIKAWSERLGIFLILSCLLSLPWLTQMRVHLPDEALQGHSVQYLYFHVPCAFVTLGLYSMMCGLSFLVLLWNIKLCYDAICSLLFPCFLTSVCTLLSGALWGKETWGTFWVWDARLTSFLVLSLFLLFLLLATSSVQKTPSKSYRKTICLLILVGFLDVMLTHFAVEWFHTLHQGRSLFSTRGNQIDHVFAVPLYYYTLHTFLWAMGFVLSDFSIRMSEKRSLPY